MACALEKRLDEKITRLVKSRGGWIVKIHGGPFMPKGIPDHLICYRGCFVAVESKAAEGKTSALQDATIKQIVKAGGLAFSTRRIEDVEEALDRIDAALV